MGDTSKHLDTDMEKRSESSAVSGPSSGSDHQDGVFYQNELGPRPKRRHFFSGVDFSHAQAVNLDAEKISFTLEEDHRIKRKIDNRILPLIICGYRTLLLRYRIRTDLFFLAFFVRLSLVPICSLVHVQLIFISQPICGNTHIIPAFNQNFGITDNNKWTLALSIFYVGYFLQRHIGANRFFFISLLFWGLSSLSIVYAKGYGALLVLRVLLGIGETGYYAGVIYYMSFWYKRHELAMRISLGMTATYSGAIGGLLAFGLVRAKTSLLVGWQFLYLIEAIPTIIMAFMTLFFLPSFPFSATFLTPHEKAIAQARVNRDHKPQSHGGTGWQGLKAILIDPNAWMFMSIYASFNVGVATISYFLPTLINDLGFTAINAQGLTVAPYVVGWGMVVLQAWHSDRTRERGWHIVASCLIAFVGYVILATTVQKSVGASYFALFLVVGGLYSLFPLVMSWAANVFSPTSKRGVGTAFIVSISNTVSIASPQIYFDPGDEYRKGHAIAAGCVFFSMLMAFTLRMRLSRLNKRNARRLEEMSEEEKAELGPIDEMNDQDPRYVFTL
ncbi:hypothetical protein D9757_001246 [Collybiopsis confluens]|uniref:Major facilitator superfamily (MFS) profile domain-containing protein n=1 Tax=Collybiopsis confluens TaxID=2823264 RepID=A0A8H5CNR6_9AGAR|nr:hypothetical protein D9757_014092 [Collybiopsis confluens]KAF5393088.1 hypothetical protein D9757_001246 [Collybiopsis confluens]